MATLIYDRMRDDIIAGLLRPGTKLRAEFLRERYEVGTSPVREALNRLAADGLVVHEDQRGFRVSMVSRDDLIELTKTRCWLEEIALRESIESGDAQWEEGIVVAFHRLSRVPRSSSESGFAPNSEWEQLHREFHRSLISSCGSHWLTGFCEQLSAQAHRYRQLAVSADYPRRNELDEHRAIMESTVARNSDGAAELLTEHFRRTVDIILAKDLPTSAVASNGTTV